MSARVQDVALGAGLVICLLGLLAGVAHQVLEVLAGERERRARTGRPRLVTAPGPDPVEDLLDALQPVVDDFVRARFDDVELAPCLFDPPDDEIARTVRRVHMDGTL